MKTQEIRERWDSGLVPNQEEICHLFETNAKLRRALEVILGDGKVPHHLESSMDACLDIARAALETT